MAIKENKDDRLTIRITEHDKKVFRTIAIAEGISFSKAVRKAIDKYAREWADD